MAYFLLVCALLASVSADYATDVRINTTYVAFMQQFQAFVHNTSYQAVLEAYGSNKKTQSFAEIQQLANNITGTVLDQYKPIAYKIIYDAGYNIKGNYYIYDNTTKSWHLPSQAPPATSIDGAAVNAKQLGKELENAFVGLMPKDIKSSGLQKRFFGRFFSSQQTTAFLRNIEMKPAKEILENLAAYRQSAKELLEARPKDKQLLDAFEKSVQDQQSWRASASGAASGTVDEGIDTNNLKEFLEKVDAKPSYHERKSDLKGKLNELIEKAEKTDVDSNDIAVIKKELDWLENLIRKDAGSLFRSKITAVIFYIFA